MEKTRKFSKPILFVLAAALIVSVFAMAACAKKEVTVTYMVGETQYQQVTGKPGEQMTAVAAPVKEGYTFSGWAKADGTAFTDTVYPADDVMVSAKLDPIKYNVIFDTNGGTGVKATSEAFYDSNVSVPSQTSRYGKTGYNLGGWALTADAEAADFALGGEIKNLTVKNGDTVTLYAFYVKKPTDANNFVASGGVIEAYFGSEEVLTLPSEYTVIGADAFAGNTKLKEVYIPDTYTEIGRGAFSGCTNLEKITAPFIGGGEDETAFLAYIFGATDYTENRFAFNAAPNEGGTDIEIDEESMTANFVIPRKFRVFVLNKQIDEIAEGAFYSAFGLEKVIAYPYPVDASAAPEDIRYEYKIKSVGASAFENCFNFSFDSKANASYYHGWLAGVENFGNKSFKGYVSNDGQGYLMSNLDYLGNLASVKNIGSEAFANHSGLAYVTFGENLETIGDDAFYFASMLQKVVIPDSVKTIGASAFMASRYLSSVTIGSGITSIGELAFASNQNLTEVIFKGNVPSSVPSSAFAVTRSGNTYDCNEGEVFYFADEAKKSVGETVISYAKASHAVVGRESDPYFSYGNGGVDFYLTFSEGHTVTMYDPLGRTGLGMPVMVGSYEKIAADKLFYADDIYNITIGGVYGFTVTLDYTLFTVSESDSLYRVNTFNIEAQVRDETPSVRIGDKTNGYYFEQNAYGQVALFQNGQMKQLVSGASFAVGSVTGYYADGTIRSLRYRQSTPLFEVAKDTDGKDVDYEFIYTPNPDKPDDTANGIYNGTLHLVTDAQKNGVLFGTYTSSEGVSLVIDAITGKATITRVIPSADPEGEDTVETVISGSYSMTGSFGDATLSVTVTDTTDSTKSVTLTFSDYLEQVVYNGQRSNLYARAKMTYDNADYVFYNVNFVANITAIDPEALNGETLSFDEMYLMIQYRLYVAENGDVAAHYEYVGFGEYIVQEKSGETTVETVTYFAFTEGTEKVDNQTNYFYTFTYDADSSTEKVPFNPNTGWFTVGSGESAKTYTPFDINEYYMVFMDGTGSEALILLGNGEAVYMGATAADQKTGIYFLYSSTPVLQYTYNNRNFSVYEYAFVPSDGSAPMFFALDMNLPVQELPELGYVYQMMRPDETAGSTYYVFDEVNFGEKVPVASFESNGYGMGILTMYVDANGNLGIGEQGGLVPVAQGYAQYAPFAVGSSQLRLTNELGDGLFVFEFAVEDYNDGKIGVMKIASDEYGDWFLGAAARLINGSLYPRDEDFVPMLMGSEAGTYTAGGVSVVLDGNGGITYTGSEGNMSGTYKLSYNTAENTYTFSCVLDSDPENVVQYTGTLAVSDSSSVLTLVGAAGSLTLTKSA